MLIFFCQPKNCGGRETHYIQEKRLSFLLSRFSAGFYATVFAYERLTVETFGVESRGFSFQRCYRILREDTVVSEACAVWALVDIQQRRPIRVSEYKPGFSYGEMLTFDIPPRIVFPSGSSLQQAGQHTVGYGEADQNMHLNNTRYSDMLCNALDLTKKRICRMSFNFINEARLADTISIYSVHHGEDDFFRTFRSDGKVNVEAQIKLGDI